MAATSSPGAYVANRPNEVWQIDHTSSTSLWLTNNADGRWGALSEIVTILHPNGGGFYLSLDPPSSTSAGLCLLHAAYEKTAWPANEITISGPLLGCHRSSTAITAWSFTLTPCRLHAANTA